MPVKFDINRLNKAVSDINLPQKAVVFDTAKFEKAKSSIGMLEPEKPAPATIMREPIQRDMLGEEQYGEIKPREPSIFSKTVKALKTGKEVVSDKTFQIAQSLAPQGLRQFLEVEEDEPTAQEAFKWLFHGMPEDPELIDKAVRGTWQDVARNAWGLEPDYAKPETISTIKRIIPELAVGLGGVAGEFTRPELWAKLYGTQKVAEFVLTSLPPKWQQFLLKERFRWGKSPSDLARKELGLPRKYTTEQAKTAWRKQALKWHPDKAPKGKETEYATKWMRVQGAYDKIKADLEGFKPPKPIVTPEKPAERGLAIPAKEVPAVRVPSAVAPPTPKPPIIPAAVAPTQVTGTHLFPSVKPGTCGECSTRSILSMHGKDVDVEPATEEGISPRKITSMLNEKGVNTEIKDNIAYDSITPQSIVYYPKADHYVTVENVTPESITVNDSDFDKPQELSRKAFESKWLDTDKKGYAIETGEVEKVAVGKPPIDRRKPTTFTAEYVKELKQARLRPTGLPNKEFGERIISKSLTKTEKTGSPTSVTFFDVDNMKQLNESKGHQWVDGMLKELGSIMKENVSPRSVVYNPYGDEFLTANQAPSDRAVAEAKALQGTINTELAKRGYEGVTVSGGTATATSKTSVKDIINQAEGELVEAKKVKPVVAKKPALTAEEQKIVKPKEKEVSRVTVEELEKGRKKYGLADIPTEESKKWVSVFKEAETRKHEATAISKAILKKARVLTNEEFAVLALRKADLESMINEAEASAAKAIDSGNKVEQERYAGVSANALIELDEITESLRFSNREAGRALNIIKVALEKEKEQYKIAKILQKAKLSKGKTLTTEEIAKFRELAQKIKVLEQKESDLNKQIETLEEQLSKKDAEKNFVKTVKGKARKVKAEKLTEEREALFKQLNKIGYRLNEITGVTYESAKIISQLSINYFQSGIKSVEKIAEKISNKLPDVSKKDVYDSLGGRIKRTKAIVVSDTKRQVIELKKQARLLGQIEDAYNNIFGKPTKRPLSSKKVAELKKKLKDLKYKAEISVRDEARLKEILLKIDSVQDQIDRGIRIKKNKHKIEPADIKQAKQDLSEARRLLDANNKIADLEKQLETGDFKVPVRVQRVVKRADLLEAQVKLSQLRREVREHIHRLRPRTGREIFVDVASLPRELMATADFSGAGRQGAILSALDPIGTLKILKDSLPAFFKQNKADEIDVLIKQHENHETRIKAGLKIKSLENIKFSDREEFFLSSLGEKIPLYGHVVKASNRHMVSHLNLLRVMAFDRYLNLYPDATDTELKDWANYVNIASGIGDMGAFNKVASELSVGFFSPRFSTSRIQLPYEVLKYRRSPRVRKEIAKNFMKFLSMVGLALWLAKLGGAEVELNPEDPDWLKIKIGDTRIDLWGGLQQPARVTVLSVMKTLSTFGVLKMKKSIDLYNAVARFIRYKLSPAVSAPLELMQAKTAIGEEVKPWQTGLRIITPLAVEEVVETYRSNALLGSILAPFILLGVGVGTYEDRAKKKTTPEETTYYERTKSRKVEKFYEGLEKRERKKGKRPSWM